MRDFYIAALGFLLSGLVIFLCGYEFGRRKAETRLNPNDKIKVDTLVIIDTITQIKPIYRTKYVKDSIEVLVHDTIDRIVYVPREVRVYEDSSYRAVVSGYEPSLDSIMVFPQTHYITNERVLTKTKKTRWGFGLSVGYGVGLHDNHIAGLPYVGISLNYNLLSW